MWLSELFETLLLTEHNQFRLQRFDVNDVKGTGKHSQGDQ